MLLFFVIVAVAVVEPSPSRNEVLRLSPRGSRMCRICVATRAGDRVVGVQAQTESVVVGGRMKGPEVKQTV